LSQLARPTKPPSTYASLYNLNIRAQTWPGHSSSQRQEREREREDKSARWSVRVCRLRALTSGKLDSWEWWWVSSSVRSRARSGESLEWPALWSERDFDPWSRWPRQLTSPTFQATCWSAGSLWKRWASGVRAREEEERARTKRAEVCPTILMSTLGLASLRPSAPSEARERRLRHAIRIV